MIGKITNYNLEKGFGFIIGKDNKSYFFHQSKVLNKFELSTHRQVNFTPSTNEKGLCALEIFVVEKDTYSQKENKKNNHNSQKVNYSHNNKPKEYKQKKKKFVTIGEITLDLYDVKSAMVHGDRQNAKLLIKTYKSGTLSCYYYEDGYYGADDYARNDLKKLLSMLESI